MKNFERELPEGYEEALVVDAKNKKFSLIFNGISLFVTIAFVLLGLFIVKPTFSFKPLRLFVYCGGMLGYIVLHELVHGVAYKALTKEKLTFGMTLTVAFCGVPQIYVYRKTALVALLAPFVVFSVVFGLCAALLPNGMDQFFAFVMLGLHVGGCSGDLYGAGLYLFKFKEPTVLMQDTGPKQTFYVRKK